MRNLLYTILTFCTLCTLCACGKLSILDFSLGTKSLVMYAGQTTQIKVGISYAGADTVELHFTSADETVAMVDNKGNVTAVEQGNTVITVSCEDRSLECEVTVTPQVCVVGYSMSSGGVCEAFQYFDNTYSSFASGMSARPYSVIFNGEKKIICGEGKKATNTEENAEPWRAMYWTDGKATTLDNSEFASTAYGIIMAGDSLLVVGVKNDAEGNINAYLWTPKTTVCLGNDAIASTVKHYGNNIYIGGTMGDAPTLWINGTPNSYPGVGEINAIDVVEGVVYAVGTSLFNGVACATLWTDGVATIISETASEGIDLSVYRGTVSVCGSVGNRGFVWDAASGISIPDNSGAGNTFTGIEAGKNGVMLSGYTAIYDIQSSALNHYAILWQQEPITIAPTGTSSYATAIVAR